MRDLTPPRVVPRWDEFYMGLAYVYASRSKDPSTQCGAVVVDRYNVPLGFGYNGPPRQYPDEALDWSRPAKYLFVSHAEDNAIDHCRVTTLDALEGCTIYVTGHPCSRCMLKIVRKGISRVVYGPQAIAMLDDTETTNSRFLAHSAGLSLEQYEGGLAWLEDRVRSLEQIGLVSKH